MGPKNALPNIFMRVRKIFRQISLPVCLSEYHPPACLPLFFTALLPFHGKHLDFHLADFLNFHICDFPKTFPLLPILVIMGQK
jgi:hypothetical protein